LIDKDRHIGKATWPSGTLTTGSALALSDLATTIASCLVLDVALPGLSGLDLQKRVIILCDVFFAKDLDP
jgi:FixJ family two-component response regulator